jgi:hypothetical protein
VNPIDAAAAATPNSTLYSAITVASVLAPGICLISAATISLIHVKNPKGAWEVITEFSADLSTPLSITLGLIFLSMSVIAGYLSRELAFYLVGLMERNQGSSPPE